ncbi:hypothetical protein PMAYCL1PPCAC_33080, partial [Pristionchus mayeri]
ALFALAALACAQQEHGHEQEHHENKHLHCVQCTSEDHSDCAETGAVLAQFNKACPKLHSGAFNGAEAIGCRKILQRTGDDHTVVRQCAYSGENVDGLRKTGNSGITLFYYQCDNAPGADGLPCNGSPGFSLVASALVAVVARMFM